MTPHFAAARSMANSPIARALARKALLRAANDNDVPANDEAAVASTPQDHMLHAALRHFGEHGIGAAREARKHAEQAFFTGDSEAYHWWLSVCRALDRRLAAQLVEQTGSDRAG